MAGRSSHEMDITNGNIFPKYVAFMVPMTLSYLLQYAFNSADSIVIGKFEGAEALAAVGSTSALINLIVNFFSGLSNGVNITVATDYAAEKYDDVSDEVHTTMAAGILGGLIFGILGIVLARPMLLLMNSPDNVIGLSERYLFAYYIGMPGLVLYNFSAAILRAIGDTKRPMDYLIFSGVLNVILNLLTVVIFNMGVAGVGLATSISNYAAAILTMRALTKEESCLKLMPASIRIKKKIFKNMMKTGLPIGLQGSLFSISNIMIQSSINGFGSVYMAGNSAAQSLEGFQQGIMNANANTMLTFVGQNVGARKWKRARNCIKNILLWGAVITIAFGVLMLIFNKELLTLFTDDPEAMNVAIRRLEPMVMLAFLGVLMDSMANALRGFGYSVEPMVATLLGACIFRIVWLKTVFAAFPIYEMTFIVWPVSYVVTAFCEGLILRKRLRKFPKEDLNLRI